MKIYKIEYPKSKYVDVLTNEKDEIIQILDSNNLDHKIKRNDIVYTEKVTELPTIDMGSKYHKGILIESNDLSKEEFKDLFPEYFL